LTCVQVSHNYGLEMAKRVNTVDSITVRITVSRQSAQLLERVAQLGIYGKNPAEVAARFVDAALEKFLTVPKFNADGGQ
jgi:hypothetical protein